MHLRHPAQVEPQQVGGLRNAAVERPLIDHQLASPPLGAPCDAGRWGETIHPGHGGDG